MLFDLFKSLLLCKKPTITQKDFITAQLSAIDSDYVSVYLDESAISNFVRGRKNVSPEICVKARCCEFEDVTNYFKKNVIPLLSQNKKGNLVLALKDLIANDTDIEKNTIVEYISKQTKESLLRNNTIKLDELLAGLFLYSVTDTKNNGTTNYVNSITSDYISSFDDKKQSLFFIEDESSIDTKAKESHIISEDDIEENTFEEARIFCIEHEQDLHLLPICEMAAVLHPKHQHNSPMINAFNKQKRKVQKAILVSERIKPYEHCSLDKINICLNDFETEIKERKYFTIPFLYGGAKYFHRALERYSDYRPIDMNPYDFKLKYASETLAQEHGNLVSYIDDFEYGLEHHPEDKNIAPFDLVWNKNDLSICNESFVVFWINRFIVSACQYLHGTDCDAMHDESWIYKDIVDESKLATLEELYYYALFLLYNSYSDEKNF